MESMDEYCARVIREDIRADTLDEPILVSVDVYMPECYNFGTNLPIDPDTAIGQAPFFCTERCYDAWRNK